MLLLALFVASFTPSARTIIITYGGVKRTLDPKFLAIFPRQIVVFVRIPGWSSLDVLARYFRSSPFIVRSDSFVMMVRTALTVCSRTIGATSKNPVTCEIIRRNKIEQHYVIPFAERFDHLPLSGAGAQSLVVNCPRGTLASHDQDSRTISRSQG